MSRNFYCRIVIWPAIGAVLLIMSIGLLFCVELWRTQREMDTVLSDLFSVILKNAPIPSQGQNTQVIIMRDAQPGTEETTGRWHLLLSQNLRFPQASFVTRASFCLTNAFPTHVRAKLHLQSGAEFVFLSNNELDHMTRDEFLKRFPDNHTWERFSISQLGLNFNKTEAILYLDHSCAGLCGGGGYMMMRKVDGVWRVVEEHPTWVS